MIKIAYMSITGNCRTFVNNLDIPKENLVEFDATNIPQLKEGDRYLMVVPTYEASLTEPCWSFIEENPQAKCIGLMGSGNRNFGKDMYIFSAQDLSKEFNIPIVYDFEYFGLDSDIKAVNSLIAGLEN